MWCYKGITTDAGLALKLLIWDWNILQNFFSEISRPQIPNKYQMINEEMSMPQKLNSRKYMLYGMFFKHLSNILNHGPLNMLKLCRKWMLGFHVSGHSRKSVCYSWWTYTSVLPVQAPSRLQLDSLAVLDVIFEGLIDQQSVTENSTRIVQNDIKVKGQGHLKLDQLSPLYRFSSENKEQKSKCRKLRSKESRGGACHRMPSSSKRAEKNTRKSARMRRWSSQNSRGSVRPNGR